MMRHIFAEYCTDDRGFYYVLRKLEFSYFRVHIGMWSNATLNSRGTKTSGGNISVHVCESLITSAQSRRIVSQMNRTCPSDESNLRCWWYVRWFSTFEGAHYANSAQLIVVSVGTNHETPNKKQYTPRVIVKDPAFGQVKLTDV